MEGGKAMSGKMSHQQKQASSGTDGKNSDPLKCRSLVCDSTGIIIAEMVYRCMICNSVTDSITEARAHYQSNHMEEEDEEQEEEYKFTPSNESIRYQSPYNSQQSSSAARSPMDQTHGRQSGSSFRNALVPDVSLFEGNSVLPLKFSNHHNNNNNNNSINHNNNNHLQHNNNNHLSYKSNHSGPMDQQQPSHVPQGQMSATSTNGSNTKSGYVNCAVCGVTRFYSCVQRRYGQFTCVTCYRYFRTFLLKPKRYACPTLGSCPLNVRTRCRACWIKGCIAVFSVDSRRQAVIEANLPVRRNAAGVTSNSPVKSLLPPPPPLASFAAETNGSNGVTAGDADGQADEEEDEEEQDDGEQSLSHDSEKESSGYDAMLEPEVSLTEDADGDEDNQLEEDEAVDADEDEGEMDGSSLTEDQMATGDQHHRQSHQQQQQQQFQHQQHQRHQMLQQHHASITHSTPPKLVTTIRPSLVNKLIVTGKKVWSCGKCMTCTAEDCGKCIYCLDRPKFGGPFIKKQRCIKRRCLMKIKNNKTNTLLRK